jgi:colicin import membrane protein
VKAALEAWGAGNLFDQGAARETDDPDVVAATMAKPGVVLRRPAGSNGPFAQHSDLPTGRQGGASSREPGEGEVLGPEDQRKGGQRGRGRFERERKQREAERRRELAEEAKKRERRDRAVAKAQAAFDKAEREHDVRAGDIEAERVAIEKRPRTRRLAGRKGRGS